MCSIRGHVTPAAHAARLRPDVDATLGLDLPNGHRLSRCLRCDTWVAGPSPRADTATYDAIPPIAELVKPRRGRPLDDAIVLRLIAVERAVHAVLFGLLAAALFLLDRRLSSTEETAQHVAHDLRDIVGQTGRGGSLNWVADRLDSVTALRHETIRVLMVTAIVYAIVEGVEAVGLWLEQRWAEYLTAIATAGFLPLELAELHKRVTVLRVSAIVVNIAVLVYLVWSKRLFGLRGGAAALHEQTEWEAILAPPAAAGPMAAPPPELSRTPSVSSSP